MKENKKPQTKQFHALTGIWLNRSAGCGNLFRVFFVFLPGFYCIIAVGLLCWVYTEFIKDVMRASHRNFHVLKFVVTLLTIVKRYVYNIGLSFIWV